VNTVAAGYGKGSPAPLLRKWIDKNGVLTRPILPEKPAPRAYSFPNSTQGVVNILPRPLGMVAHVQRASGVSLGFRRFVRSRMLELRVIEPGILTLCNSFWLEITSSQGGILLLQLRVTFILKHRSCSFHLPYRIAYHRLYFRKIRTRKVAGMIVPCKCPGQLRKKLFAIVIAEGKTAKDATSALKVKVAAKEQEFSNELDKWIASVRCVPKGCAKRDISWTSSAIPPLSVDFGDKWKALTSLSGVALVFCKTAVEVQKLVPKKLAPKKD
jgi:hypothetical protein